MYEDRTQNYDQEIHEESDTCYTLPPATSLISLCRLLYSYKHN